MWEQGRRRSRRGAVALCTEVRSGSEASNIELVPANGAI